METSLSLQHTTLQFKGFRAVAALIHTALQWDVLLAALSFLVVVQIMKMAYNSKIHGLKAIPGSWINSFKLVVDSMVKMEWSAVLQS